jgi:hypothetical protein
VERLDETCLLKQRLTVDFDVLSGTLKAHAVIDLEGMFTLVLNDGIYNYVVPMPLHLWLFVDRELAAGREFTWRLDAEASIQGKLPDTLEFIYETERDKLRYSLVLSDARRCAQELFNQLPDFYRPISKFLDSLPAVN